MSGTKINALLKESPSDLIKEYKEIEKKKAEYKRYEKRIPRGMAIHVRRIKYALSRLGIDLEIELLIEKGKKKLSEDYASAIEKKYNYLNNEKKVPKALSEEIQKLKEALIRLGVNIEKKLA